MDQIVSAQPDLIPHIYGFITNQRLWGQSNKSIDFQLGMNMLYCCGNKESETVVYEGASADGLLHTIRLKDNTKLIFYDSNLQLLYQPNFLNMPRAGTPSMLMGVAGSNTQLGTSYV